jgi:hypothetical protein
MCTSQLLSLYVDAAESKPKAAIGGTYANLFEN